EPLSFLLFVILLAPSTLEFDTHSRNTNTQFIMSRRVNASTDAAKEVTASPPMDKQKRLLEESDPGHFSMIRAMHLADLITLLNGAKKSSLMGQELDSLADLISFCVSPAVASVAIGMRTPLDHFLLTSFALCGLLRLARFNITTDSVPKDANGKAKYFEGLPTPTSLGIVSLISFWVSKGWIHDQLPFGVFAEGSIFEFHPAALIFVAHGCLMISKTFHVPKP
ncbi:unnamed protein product, partial [Aureobasidium pullulans]